MGSKMSSKIALRLAALAVGAAFATAPALAQQQPSPNQGAQYLRSDSPPAAENGPASQPGFINVWNNRRTYNYAPGPTGYSSESTTGPTDYYNYEPGYEAGPAAEGPSSESIAECEARFRSYDPATGMYRGFDGVMHPCP